MCWVLCRGFLVLGCGCRFVGGVIEFGVNRGSRACYGVDFWGGGTELGI